MNDVLPEPEAITHYYRSPSQDLSLTPADAGRAEDVVRCVANLFQKGTVCKIALNSSHVLFKNGIGYTYEIHFLRGGRTLKRRYTVYRLCGVHSKSECYQVTDPKGKYMVVKIPPQAISDINAYLKAVTHERNLAQKLFELGIKVVVPCVSSVMRHLQKLDYTKKLSPCEIEEAYLGILRITGNKYAEQFKIRDKYVFFMEFLDEPFLGKVVREFYNKEMLVNLRKEYFEKDLILVHSHDRVGFVSKYKHIGTVKYLYDIFNGLKESFDNFCLRVDSILSLYSISLGILKQRNWFVTVSFGKPIEESSLLEHWNFENDQKELFVNRLNSLLNKPVENSGSFKRYLEILDQEVHWAVFKYSARKMKMIGNKLLILLVMLEETGLVLRDLKVDNLFIADDENMELGVIDLETGGDIGSGKIEGIVPAGMPSNMTISNLLFVSQLRRIYGEEKVNIILHMQDWYATISMMFETNIGTILFDDARKYILKINRRIDEKLALNYSEFVRNNPGVKVTPDMIETFISLSDDEVRGHTWQFWTLAQQNLKRKCLKYKTKLKEIKYDLPSALKSKFFKDIEEELAQIQENYRSYKLTAASIDYLNMATTTVAVLQNNLALKEKLYFAKMNNQPTKNIRKIKLAQEIEIYKACIIQKQNENLLIKKRKLLNREHTSAFDLFPIMLHFITREMCRDEWFKHSPEALSISSGKKYKNSQSIIIPAEGWKSTIIPTKEELAQMCK